MCSTTMRYSRDQAQARQDRYTIAFRSRRAAVNENRGRLESLGLCNQPVSRVLKLPVDTSYLNQSLGAESRSTLQTGNQDGARQIVDTQICRASDVAQSLWDLPKKRRALNAGAKTGNPKISPCLEEGGSFPELGKLL